MKTPEYQKETERTEHSMDDYFDVLAKVTIQDTRLIHHSFGMITEAGEIADQIKRHIFYGTPLNRENLIEEIGDMFWYCAGMCNTLGIDIEEVMKLNNQKLRVRYPEKFDRERAVNRDISKELEEFKK